MVLVERRDGLALRDAESGGTKKRVSSSSELTALRASLIVEELVLQEPCMPRASFETVFLSAGLVRHRVQAELAVHLPPGDPLWSADVL